MYRYILLVVLILMTMTGQAQSDQTIVAEFHPLVATIPADWTALSPRGEAVFEFSADNFRMTVYKSFQFILEANEINPNDLDAAIKRYPFTPFPTGQRSLTDEGWRYRTIEFEDFGVEMVIRDYSYGDDPETEFIRVMDSGMIILAQVEYSTVDYSESPEIVEVFTGIRMTEQGEYECQLADLGDVPIYSDTDTTSEQLNISPADEILNYFYVDGDAWFRVSNGGFISFDDVSDDMYIEANCFQVPYGGERVPAIAPETVELTEIYRLPDGYYFQYPASGGWTHVDDRNILQNGIISVTFELYPLDLPDQWQADSESTATPDGDCVIERQYKEHGLNNRPIYRYTITDYCSESTISPYKVLIGIQRDERSLLVAEVTPIFPQRPIWDVTVIERSLATLTLSDIGEVTCTTVTEQDSQLYEEAKLDSTVVGNISSDTEIEIQGLADDQNDEWWAQLKSGEWILFDAIDWQPDCILISHIDLDED